MSKKRTVTVELTFQVDEDTSAPPIFEELELVRSELTLEEMRVVAEEWRESKVLWPELRETLLAQMEA